MLQGLRFVAVAEIIHDPTQIVEDALVALEEGTPQATSWMQKLRNPVARRVEVHSVSGGLLYDGRACCGDQLRRYEGRGDVVMPFEVTCPDCGRIYRVRLDLVRRR